MKDLVFFTQAKSTTGQSENGEDGIIERIFQELGIKCSFCVEFGAGDGIKHSITYPFRLAGAKSLLMDGIVEMNKDFNGRSLGDECETSASASAASIRDNNQNVKIEFINAENINSLFAKYRVPYDFELLVIDIDGNEYHVWNALEYKPDIVMIEYNQYIRPELKCTIPYDPNFRTTVKNRFVSASCSALACLGKQKGYTLVEVNVVNMFFVRNELADRLKTAVTYQNDALFLFLKNHVSDGDLDDIYQMNKGDQITACSELRDLLLKLYDTKKEVLLKKMNIPLSGHKWGPWEFLD